MQMSQVQISLRQEELKEWFNSNPAEWESLKQEIFVCLNNANNALKSVGCQSREFYAGKCSGIEEILKLEFQFKE